MQFVDSSDGVQIAVYEEGNPDGPTVVLVHGWPDSHVLWDGVAPLLADRFRIVRYDNRGAGRSSVPKPSSAYTMSCFADDFAAVIGAVAARGTGARAGPRLGFGRHVGVPGPPWRADRVASFTSVSGPSADHINRFVLGSLKRPVSAAAVRAGARPAGATVLYGVGSRYLCLAPMAVRRSSPTTSPGC